METKNAIIISAEIYIEDHGILTATVRLDYGSIVQGFGGYNLDMDGEAKSFIRGCLKAAGVDKWSELKGKTIRVRATPSHVLAIGHIIKDEWFSMGGE